MTAVFPALEQLLVRAAEDQAALLAARDEWSRRAGAVHDDDPLYEERTAAFLDWFALDRRGADGRSPVERLLAEAAGAAERAALSAMASSHRSLFKVRERHLSGQGGLLLDDLWGGGVFRARERRSLAGVDKGDLLDARLLADAGAPPQLLLLRIACVHPREAEGAIRRHVAQARRAGEPREELLFRLLRLRLRGERYRHVTPARVYEAGEPR